jgi:hypothetical protein
MWTISTPAEAAYGTDGIEDHPQAHSGWRGPRGANAGRGRGYMRGGRVPQIHRNRSLVLNNGASTVPLSEIVKVDPHNEASSSSTPAWVTKTDRHLQLINSSIYEKQTQQRAKAMEETRKLRLRQRDERERLKLSKHLQRLGDSSGLAGTGSSTVVPNHEILIQGIRFRVMNNGSKLVKVSGKNTAKEMTALRSISLSYFESDLTNFR